MRQFAIKQIKVRFQRNFGKMVDHDKAFEIKDDYFIIKIQSSLPQVYINQMQPFIKELQKNNLISQECNPTIECIEASINPGFLIVKIPIIIYPTLIFGEIHDRPVTTEVLTKLAPKLRQLGYRSFFDEMSAGCSLEIKLRDANLRLNEFERLKKSFESQQLDIQSEEDQLQYVKHFIVKHPNHELDTIQSVVKDIIKRKPSLLAEKNFLMALSEHRIEYKPIDHGRLAGDSDDALLIDKFDLRDKLIADAYLQEPAPVFGRNGMMHHSGIQKNISGSLQHQASGKKYIFFVIRSSTEQKGKDLWKEVWQSANFIDNFHDFSNAEKFPFGIVKIDDSKMNVDEIANYVLDTIKSSIKLPSRHSDLTPAPSQRESKLNVDSQRLWSLRVKSATDQSNFDRQLGVIVYEPAIKKVN